MIKIKLDENGYVNGYCTIGDIENSVVVDNAPENFERYFMAYRLIDGKLIPDSAMLERIDNEVNDKV